MEAKKQGIFMRALASDSTEATISIIGVIGWEVAYDLLRDMLRSIPETVERVVFDIFSPGGDVWEGNGIVQEIGELNKRCETVARVQVAASMATLIAVACKERSIASNGRFLIHNAWAGCTGDAAEMEKMAASLRDCETEAAAFYAQQCGGDAEAMLALMAEERWMMPEEVLELGFVDEISDPFTDDEFAAVKDEIVAAGKWPKSLAEMPDVSEEAEVDAEVETEAEDESEDSDADETDTGAEQDEAEPESDAESAPVDKTYEQGLADAEIKYAESVEAMCSKVEESRAEAESAEDEAEAITADATEQLAKRDEALSEMQSNKDKAAAEAEKREASLSKTVDELRGSLEVANGRLNKLLGGSMAFTPAPVETWEEALEKCSGDYAEAAKLDPTRELRKVYNEKHQHGKR